MNQPQAHFETDDELRPLHEELTRAMPVQPAADLAERVYGQTVHLLPQRRHSVSRVTSSRLLSCCLSHRVSSPSAGDAATIDAPEPAETPSMLIF